MALEFNCPACQLRIQTPDESGGKQARCPGCQTVAPIPYYSTPHAHRTPPASAAPNALQASPQLNPFRDTVAAPNTDIAVAPSSHAPAGRPSAATRPLTRQDVRRKLLIPAIGLLLVGGACLAFMALVVASVFSESREENFPGETISMSGLFIAMSIPPLLMIIGAIAMFRGRNSTAVWAGSVAAVLPCWIGFPLAAPFGIWAIAVMFDPQVELVLDSSG